MSRAARAHSQSQSRRAPGAAAPASARGRDRANAPRAVSALAQAADSNRASLVVVLFALLALAFLGRLVYLQVIVADEYSARPRRRAR